VDSAVKLNQFETMMKFLLAFVYSVVLPTLVAASPMLEYHQIITNMASGQLIEPDDAVTSGLIEVYNDNPYKTALNISLFSFTNAQVLNDTIAVYDYAQTGQRWGDARLLREFIERNGQNVNFLKCDSFLTILLDEIEDDETLPEIWANSSTDILLAAFYSDLDSRARTSTELGDKALSIAGDGSLVLYTDDCENLLTQIKGKNINAEIQIPPRQYCWGFCCVTWAASASLLIRVNQ
jgi:hypothetical protein